MTEGREAAGAWPATVLFVCNFNTARSPIAEALLKRLAGDRIYVDSCGVEPALQAGDGVGADPFALAAMAEVGVDLSGHRAKSLDELCKSAAARLHAQKADELINRGDLRGAKREMQLALHQDGGNNAELADRLDALDLALFAMGE